MFWGAILRVLPHLANDRRDFLHTNLDPNDTVLPLLLNSNQCRGSFPLVSAPPD